MSVRASVVVPVRDGARVIGRCVSALARQSLDREAFEVIVVDDGSRDGTAREAAREGVRVITRDGAGAPAARNAGIAVARGRWVAFTDADCVPARRWLEALVAAAESAASGDVPALGAAGRTLGLPSEGPAARFVELTGGLDAERHLSHPRFPFAPTCNVLYRREALSLASGFDERFASYDACDLHRRLLEVAPGPMAFAPGAVVLHEHRPTWPAYWRQQRGYGRGYGQFMLRHRDAVEWTARREAAAWGRLALRAAAACVPGSGEPALRRRGTLVRELASRLGTAGAYWSPAERRRWQ